MAKSPVKLHEWHDAEAKIVLPDVISIDVLAELLKKHQWLKLAVQEVDFSQVVKADSAILAVLLVWAQQCDDMLVVRQLPAELQTLVKLYDLDSSITLI